jgi:hypothetical protein
MSYPDAGDNLRSPLHSLLIQLHGKEANFEESCGPIIQSKDVIGSSPVARDPIGNY